MKTVSKLGIEIPILKEERSSAFFQRLGKSSMSVIASSIQHWKFQSVKQGYISTYKFIHPCIHVKL